MSTLTPTSRVSRPVSSAGRPLWRGSTAPSRRDAGSGTGRRTAWPRSRRCRGQPRPQRDPPGRRDGGTAPTHRHPPTAPRRWPPKCRTRAPPGADLPLPGAHSRGVERELEPLLAGARPLFRRRPLAGDRRQGHERDGDHDQEGLHRQHVGRGGVAREGALAGDRAGDREQRHQQQTCVGGRRSEADGRQSRNGSGAYSSAGLVLVKGPARVNTRRHTSVSITASTAASVAREPHSRRSPRRPASSQVTISGTKVRWASRLERNRTLQLCQ